MNVTKINYKGKEYDLVFNLNVMEKIQEKYGTVEAWGELANADGEPKIKDIKYGFVEMLNEGIDIYNEDHEDKRDFFTDKQVGRIISELGIDQIASKLNETVIESVKSDEKNS